VGLRLELELRLGLTLSHEKGRVEGEMEGGTDAKFSTSVRRDDELDFCVVFIEDDHLIDDTAEARLYSLGHNVKEGKVLCKHRDGIARGVDKLLVAVLEDDRPLLDL